MKEITKVPAELMLLCNNQIMSALQIFPLGI